MIRRDRFPLPLIVHNHADGRAYPFQTMGLFVYRWPGMRGRPAWDVVVPFGYETDFASIPRVAQGVFDATNLVARPAIVHDLLYSIEIVPRWLADRIFLDAMRDVGMSLAHRRIFWSAVRAAGWTKFPHPRREVEEDRRLYAKGRDEWEASLIAEEVEGRR